MEYNIGDKIIINSLKWYKKNKNYHDEVDVPFKFLQSMSIYCGKTATIIEKNKSIMDDSCLTYYSIDIDKGTRAWSKEMFQSIKDVRKLKLNKINENSL